MLAPAAAKAGTVDVTAQVNGKASKKARPMDYFQYN
jgi:hypothetical protein